MKEKNQVENSSEVVKAQTPKKRSFGILFEINGRFEVEADDISEALCIAEELLQKNSADIEQILKTEISAEVVDIYFYYE